MSAASPTIHLFFNGQECFFPPGAAWEKFQGLDAGRTFLICAESWRRNGWQLRRMTTTGEDFIKTPFLPKGQVSKSWDWYPFPFWQFIAKAKTIAATDPGKHHWFGTIDVINFCFGPEAAQSYLDGQQCLSFQNEHFSLSLVACTHAWLVVAEKILMSYDSGTLPELERRYVSDETILRHYGKAKLCPAMTFANNTTRSMFPLCHFSRSALPSGYADIKTS